MGQRTFRPPESPHSKRASNGNPHNSTNSSSDQSARQSISLRPTGGTSTLTLTPSPFSPTSSAQDARLDSYVDSQPGWRHTVSFTDDASGASTHRPGLQRALQAARAGLIDVLVVYCVDRFSRKLRDLVTLGRYRSCGNGPNGNGSCNATSGGAKGSRNPYPHFGVRVVSSSPLGPSIVGNRLRSPVAHPKTAGRSRSHVRRVAPGAQTCSNRTRTATPPLFADDQQFSVLQEVGVLVDTPSGHVP
ncbi:recombinase family protein [Nocardia sp. CA-119907]|uniref:recombinase family protein n=1 Tax=Nocardia sp. CA-119907 TaxID=3239973 RepID=UPI003D995A4F